MDGLLAGNPTAYADAVCNPILDAAPPVNFDSLVVSLKAGGGRSETIDDVRKGFRTLSAFPEPQPVLMPGLLKRQELSTLSPTYSGISKELKSLAEHVDREGEGYAKVSSSPPAPLRTFSGICCTSALSW